MARKRSKKGRRVAWGCAFFVCAILVVFFQSTRPVAREGESVATEVVVNSGDGIRAIAHALKEKKLIRREAAFIGLVKIKGWSGQLKAGAYRLSPAMSATDIVRALVQGEARQERTVRLLEGWTIHDMDAYFAREKVFEEGAFIAAAERMLQECRMAGEAVPDNAIVCQPVQTIPKNVNTLEGYLFPDTYRLYLDATPDDVAVKMLARFSEKISDTETQEMLHGAGYTLHEIVTLASIVEAEVPHADERAVVAGLFWKRMEAGIPLQADSTVNYVTGKHDPAVSAADLKVDSRYNTYLYPDLPPGPIGNPGVMAIKAALAPQDSPYWFFLSTPDGTTIFSKTFDEHVAAKRKYLK